MNYKFLEKSLDEYELVYTNKEGKETTRPFKRTVELATKLQSGDKEARMELAMYMTKNGITKDDLTIKREGKNGEIIYDERNYRAFESDFIMTKAYEIAMRIYKDLFGVDFVELLDDMGLNEETADDFNQKIVDFNLELRDLLINGKVKTPSQTKGDK